MPYLTMPALETYSSNPHKITSKLFKQHMYIKCENPFNIDFFLKMKFPFSKHGLKS